MKTIHPTEEDLQAYVSGDARISATYSLHIGTCEYCQAQIVAYRFIGTEIRQTENLAFEFDLSALVVAQLPVRPAVIYKRLDYWLILAGIVCTLIALFVYRTEVIGLFAGASVLIVFACCAAAILLLVFSIWEHYQKYHRQLIALGGLNTLQP